MIAAAVSAEMAWGQVGIVLLLGAVLFVAVFIFRDPAPPLQ